MNRRQFLGTGVVFFTGCSAGSRDSSTAQPITVSKAPCSVYPDDVSGTCFSELAGSSITAEFNVRRMQKSSAILEFRVQNTSDSRIEFGPSHWELFSNSTEKWETSARGRAYDLLTYLEAGQEFLWHVDLTASKSPPGEEPPRFLSNVDYHRDHGVAVLDDVPTSIGLHAFVVREFSVDPSAIFFPFTVGEKRATTTE